MLIEGTPPPQAADDLAEWYAEQTKAWGYLPNYAPVFASRPDVAKAWMTLNLTIRGGMDRRRFELATVAASRALECTYCLAAHSKFLRDAAGAMAQHDRRYPLGAGGKAQLSAHHRFERLSRFQISIEAGRRRTREQDDAVVTIGERRHGRLREQLPGEYQRKSDEKTTHEVAVTAVGFPNHGGDTFRLVEAERRQ